MKPSKKTQIKALKIDNGYISKSMKILQVGDNDLYCKKFAGHYLHQYLNEIGYDSKQLVWTKLSNDPSTQQIAQNSKDRSEVYTLSRNIKDRYGLDLIQNPIINDIIHDPLFLNTDIVHYHLIHNNIFDLNFLPIMSHLKPTIWTLHDPWALSGHCIYSCDCNKWESGCGDCPRLNAPFEISFDNSALNFEIKRNIFSQSNLDIIVASKWMKKQVKKSIFFKNKTIYVVNYGIDQNIFKPKSKEAARKKLNIDRDALVLAFRCTNYEVKGLDYIKHVLQKIHTKQKIILLMMEGKFTDFKPKYEHIEYGWVNDDQQLVDIYNAADIFLMPSLAEAFGMMAIESMSCGTLPIVLKGTSLPEIVNAPYCGVATEINKECYYETVQYFIDHKNEREERSSKCVAFARKYYSKEVYRDNVIDIYHKVKDKFQIDKSSEHVLQQLKKYSNDYFLNSNNENNQFLSYESHKKIVEENNKKYLSLVEENNKKYLSLLNTYNRKSKDFDKVMNRKIIKFMNLLEKFTGKIKQ